MCIHHFDELNILYGEHESPSRDTVIVIEGRAGQCKI